MGLSKKITLKASCFLSDITIDVNELVPGIVNVYGRTVINHFDEKWVVTFVDTIDNKNKK